jgi:phosphatidylethanolamine-binding protein
MIDLDVARNGTRIPNLHWIAPDITGRVSGTNTTELTLAAADVENGVVYRQPSPPVGDYAHRYVFLLYEQPTTFPSSLGNLTSNRIGFNLTNFTTQNGLTTPLAANYILVANNSGPATTSYPPASFSVSSTISISSPTDSATTTGAGSAATSSGSATSSGVGVSGTASSAVSVERGSAFALLMAAAGLFVRI